MRQVPLMPSNLDGGKRSRRGGGSAALILTLLGASMAGVAQGQLITFTEFTIPTANSFPVGITPGPDGNLWFTAAGTPAARISRITRPASHGLRICPRTTRREITPARTATSGSRSRAQGRPHHHRRRRHRVRRFPRPQRAAGHHRRPGRQPLVHRALEQQDRPDHPGRRHHRVPDPDRRQRAARHHGRPGRQPLVHRAAGPDRPDHPGRRITEFPVPRPAATAGITAGPDGNLWFTERRREHWPDHHRGRVTEFPAPATAATEDITAGPDGTLWFTDFGRTRSAGSPPTESSPSSTCRSAAGPQGIWRPPRTATSISPDSGGNKIWRINLEHGPVVNDLVRLDSLIRSCQRTPVPGGSAGTCSLQAHFTNTSSTPINDPVFDGHGAFRREPASQRRRRTGRRRGPDPDARRRSRRDLVARGVARGRVRHRTSRVGRDSRSSSDVLREVGQQRVIYRGHGLLHGSCRTTLERRYADETPSRRAPWTSGRR